MTEMILSLTNQANWNQIYTESREAQPASPIGGYFPIPAFEIPIVIENNILAVRTFSNTARFSWRFAGNLSQRIQIGSGGSASTLPEVEAASISLRINRTRLLILKKLSPDYKLVFEPPYWFKSISLTIWEYTGIQEYLTDELIRDLGDDLDRIEAKIDSL